MQLAVRYNHGDVSTVLSLAGDAYLTDRPNEVAIHIEHVRAGAFPVPLAQFLDDIAERAGEAGLPIRWTEEDGDPVALVKLPLDREEFKGQKLQVEGLEIAAGEIVVSGRTEAPPTSDPAQPDPAESDAAQPDAAAPDAAAPDAAQPDDVQPASADHASDSVEVARRP